MFKKCVLFFILTILYICNGFAQSGLPDSSFGIQGRTLINATFPYFEISTACLQPDGKIILAGSIENANRDYLLIRYTANGQLDNTFGIGGIVSTSVKATSKVMKVALLSDGDIIAMGSANSGLTFARYTANGLPSNKFYLYQNYYINTLAAGIVSDYGDPKDMVEDAAGNILFVAGDQIANQLQLHIIKPDGQPAFGVLKPSVMPKMAADFVYYHSHCMLKQDDGKILIGGISDFGAGIYKLFVARIFQNGLVDSSFGVNGVAFQSRKFSNLYGATTNIHVDSKHNIVMTSSCEDEFYTKGKDSVIVTRFTKDGRADSTFGNNGRSGVLKVAADYWHPIGTTSFVQPDDRIGLAANTHNNRGHQMSIQLLSMDGQPAINVDNNSSFEGSSEIVSILNQPDGKMLVAGHALVDGRYRAALRRINADGTPDLSFANNGIVTTVVNGSSTVSQDYGYTMQITADDKMQVAGVNRNGPTQTMVLAQLNKDGSLDQQYGNNGLTYTGMNERAAWIGWGLYHQGGNIMAMSHDKVGNTYIVVTDGNQFIHEDGVVVLKYLSSGKPDLQFGLNGRKALNLQDNKQEFGIGIVTQADGKPVVGIEVSTGDQYLADDNGMPAYTALVRLSTNGTIDSSYGVNGIMKDSLILRGINGSGRYNPPQWMAIQDDGKIHVVGRPKSENAVYFFSRRYTMDGKVDSSFYYNASYGNLGQQSAASSAVMMQPDGKIILGGVAFGSGQALALRMNPDGTKDGSFGPGGMAFAGFKITEINSGAVQQDGRILVLSDNSLIRFNSFGQSDKTFGSDGNGVIPSADYLSQVVVGNDGRIMLVGAASGKIMVSGLRNVNVDCSGHKAFAGNDTTVCSGMPVVLGAPAQDGVSYLWSPQYYLDAADWAQPTASVSVWSRSRIKYTVFETYADGCSATDSVILNLNAIPYAGASYDREICQGDTVDIGNTFAGDEFVYAWTSQPEGYSSADTHPMVSPETTTTYFVKVSNAEADVCAFKDTITIRVGIMDKPVISLNGDVLNVSNTVNNVAYDWEMSGDNVKWNFVGSGVSYTASEKGVYRVNAIGICQEYSDTISFVQDTIPEPSDPGGRTVIGAYPNPVADGMLTVSGLKITDAWEKAEIMPLSGGNVIAAYDIRGRESLTLAVSELGKGYYLVVLRRKGGQPKLIRFLKM
jgi:uncharacterized delta-60 repeat protein